MSRFIDPSTKDIIDRLSRSSLSHHEHALDTDRAARAHGYDGLDTPPVGSGHAGAGDLTRKSVSDALLQEEPSKPQVRAWDRRWLGLVLHSVVVGVISTVLPLTVFPFLTNYLNMEGTQTLSARTMLALPWVLKPFFGIFTDCVPLLCGYHHRPYVMLGWLVCAASLTSIYFVDLPEPFFTDRSLVGTPLIKMTAEQRQTLNMDAPSHGGLYVMFMSVATVGYVLADVAADSLITEIARSQFSIVNTNEDEVFAPVVTKFRYLSMLATFLFMGVSMSGWNYGGDFDFTLKYNEVMLIMGILSAVPIPFMWCTVVESRRARRSFQKCFKEIWDLFHNRAINKVILFRFLGGIFGGISSTAVNPVAFYWAGVQPLNDNVVSFVATSVVLGALSYANKRQWNINYRLLIIGATLVILFLDCGATMFTIWNIVRSQWFWIGLPVMEAIPSGLDYVIFTVVLGEIADPGMEQIMSSLVTAVSFLAGPFGLVLSKYLDAKFDVTNQDLMIDTTHVRFHTTVVFFFAYLCQVISLGWLLVLPRHAAEAREWKKRSGTSTSHAVGLIVLLVLALGWTLAVHVLSVNASTACMKLAGGVGC
ncbi:Outer membrane protein pmpb, partial [Globisporangium splendens]